MTAFRRLDDCLDEAARRLTASGIESPRREARLLMAHWLDRDPAQLLGPQSEAVMAPATYFELVARRARREPLSHLLGRREFWSLDFEVGPAVLDPRPDSEILVETVLKDRPETEAPFTVLDFGTGSGCLLLSVLHERPGATGIGVDRSAAALEVAMRNARRLGVAERARFIESDWAEAVSGTFDVILANPPYIESAAIDGLAPEISVFDPRLALDGGADGLDAYRRLAPGLARLAAADARVYLEIGAGQKAAVGDIFKQAGLTICATAADLAGHVRCLVAQPRNPN